MACLSNGHIAREQNATREHEAAMRTHVDQGQDLGDKVLSRYISQSAGIVL